MRIVASAPALPAKLKTRCRANSLSSQATCGAANCGRSRLSARGPHVLRLQRLRQQHPARACGQVARCCWRGGPWGIGLRDRSTGINEGRGPRCTSTSKNSCPHSTPTTLTKYLVVGAYAVSIHAQPRATKDLDILIQADAENAKAAYAARARREPVAPAGSHCGETRGGPAPGYSRRRRH
jgi:hypothetical protein